jgi:hypothetical protein
VTAIAPDPSAAATLLRRSEKSRTCTLRRGRCLSDRERLSGRGDRAAAGRPAFRDAVLIEPSPLPDCQT